MSLLLLTLMRALTITAPTIKIGSLSLILTLTPIVVVTDPKPANRCCSLDHERAMESESLRVERSFSLVSLAGLLQQFGALLSET